MLNLFIKLANDLDEKGYHKEADLIDSIIEKMAKTPKKTKRGVCVFQSTSSLVLDGKDHFPINNKSQARNALARVNQYDEVPEWYKGNLDSLVSKVVEFVKSKYKDIEISDSAKKSKS